MRRWTAARMTWWIRLFVVVVIAFTVLDLPYRYTLPVAAVVFALAWIRPPRSERDPVVTPAPIRGRWTALNSPATSVPSHGLRAYGQTYAIDVLRPRTSPDAPLTSGWTFDLRRPETFPTFGATVHAVADGEVVAVSRRRRDHRSRTTWPSIVYLMTVEAFTRELGGAGFVLGNHVVVDHGDDVYAVYAHLRRGSPLVRVGDRVRAGDVIARVGNSGNSSEPHLHFQLMDRASATAAAGVPFAWSDVDVTDGRAEREIHLESGAVVPADGDVFAAPRPDTGSSMTLRIPSEHRP